MLKDVLHALLFFALSYIATFILWFLNFTEYPYITEIIFALIIGMIGIEWRWLKVSLFAVLTSLHTCMGLYFASAGVLEQAKSKSDQLYNYFINKFLLECVSVSWKDVSIIFICAAIGHFVKKRWYRDRNKEIRGQ